MLKLSTGNFNKYSAQIMIEKFRCPFFSKIGVIPIIMGIFYSKAVKFEEKSFLL